MAKRNYLPKKVTGKETQNYRYQLFAGQKEELKDFSKMTHDEIFKISLQKNKKGCATSLALAAQHYLYNNSWASTDAKPEGIAEIFR